LRRRDSEFSPNTALGIHEFEGLGPDKRSDGRFESIRTAVGELESEEHEIHNNESE
jgi:hypothetical protein